jgi:hypothetical protein
VPQGAHLALYLPGFDFHRARNSGFLKQKPAKLANS